MLGHRDRVLGIHALATVVTLDQPHTPPAADVNRGNGLECAQG
jgi:hypothetical protein